MNKTVKYNTYSTYYDSVGSWSRWSTSHPPGYGWVRFQALHEVGAKLPLRAKVNFLATVDGHQVSAVLTSVPLFTRVSTSHRLRSDNTTIKLILMTFVPGCPGATSTKRHPCDRTWCSLRTNCGWHRNPTTEQIEDRSGCSPPWRRADACQHTCCKHLPTSHLGQMCTEQQCWCECAHVAVQELNLDAIKT